MNNLQKLEAQLTAEYTRLFEEEPTAYLHAKARGTAADLAKRMALSLKEGHANKDGKGIARALHALGVKNTYKAIREYLKD